MTKDYNIYREKGKQSVISIGDSSSSGIEITINKRRRSLCIDGWYDSIVGIQGAEIPLDEILALFDKPRKLKEDK